MTDKPKSAEDAKHPRETPCYVVDSDWISFDDCLEHSGDWQYWRRGKRYCLGCLRDAVEKKKSTPPHNKKKKKKKKEVLRGAMNAVGLSARKS